MGVTINSMVCGKPNDVRFSQKSITFTGASGLGANAIPVSLFTVTGEVFIEKLVPYCSTDLTASAGTPTLALGVTGATTLFVAATTATAIDAGEFWTTSTPTTMGVALPATLVNVAITSDIIGTVGGTNNINGGVIRFDVYWRPLSADGNLVAA